MGEVLMVERSLLLAVRRKVDAACFKIDFQYFFLFFPTTFVLRVSFSPVPECVVADCWNRVFPTPRATIPPLFVVCLFVCLFVVVVVVSLCPNELN